MSDLDDHLRAEYLMIQGQYEAFDARALTIKSWATPLLAGGLGLGLKESSISVEIATILAAACLWLLEGIWKKFQYCYVARLQLLERYFRGEHLDLTIKPFQTFTSWSEEWNRWFSNRTALRQSLKPYFVFLPYLPLIIGSVLAIIWISNE
jgi:hypothetical protein